MNAYLKKLQSMKPPKRYKANFISFFCGGGGLDLGLELAGLKCIYATDIEKAYCETVSNNLKTITEAHDMNELTGAKIKERTGVDIIDLIAGGPPCQAFSILGNRKSVKDPRGKLVYEYVRLIKELQPEAFLMDTPGIFLSMQ